MRLAGLSLFLILVAAVAHGDANEGVLFDYKLGDRYPATAKTQRLLSGTIVANEAHLPAGLNKLLLIVTPKTYTITSIHGVAQFDDIEHAIEMKGRYSKHLVAEYSDWTNTSPNKIMPFHLLNNSYHLSVIILPTRTVGSFELRVSLEYSLGTKEHADMEALRKIEVRELIGGRHTSTMLAVRLRAGV